MGNRFGILGLGSEPVRGRTDVDKRESESTRPTEEPHPVLGTYSTYLSSPSRPEYEVSKDQNTRSSGVPPSHSSHSRSRSRSSSHSSSRSSSHSRSVVVVVVLVVIVRRRRTTSSSCNKKKSYFTHGRIQAINLLSAGY